MSEIRRTVRADAEPLAMLHAEALPTSLLTKLGPSALVRYYAFVATSTSETTWTAHEDGDIVGACVLSDEPGSVLARFARHAPLQLARELGTQMVRDRALRMRFIRRLRERTGDTPHAPEVTQIFTDRKLRGRGIGAQLLRTCEEALRTRGVQKYFVHTERDDNDAGIRFYLREGFVKVGESRSFGHDFLIFKKDLA